MAVRLIALLLTVAMWPGMSELVELTVHAATHGDVAHAEDDQHEGSPLGHDEHGCSGTFHLCPCHHPTPVATPAVAASLDLTAMTELAAHLPPRLQIGTGVTAPPTRPPIG